MILTDIGAATDWGSRLNWLVRNFFQSLVTRKCEFSFRPKFKCLLACQWTIGDPVNSVLSKDQIYSASGASVLVIIHSTNNPHWCRCRETRSDIGGTFGMCVISRNQQKPKRRQRWERTGKISQTRCDPSRHRIQGLQVACYEDSARGT